MLWLGLSENGKPAGALAEAVNKAAMQLPERVMMALVQTPAMFAVPNCINKGFAPPFIVRVGVVSAVPTQIKATIAGYVLQKEQVGPMVARIATSCRVQKASTFLTSNVIISASFCAQHSSGCLELIEYVVAPHMCKCGRGSVSNDMHVCVHE